MLLCLFGCSIKSTPKMKVEKLLMSYQNNNELIVSELNDYLNTLDIENSYYEDYKKVYLRQYQDLKYQIKDQRIDGDNAKVTAQIEVYDYYKAESEANNYISENPSIFSNGGVFDNLKAMKYKVDELNKADTRVEYIIDFNLTKVNDEWNIDNLTNEDLEKIHGTYAH